jgi:hypothetical protein
MQKLYEFIKDGWCAITLEYLLIAGAFSLAAFAGATIIIGILHRPGY